MTYLKEAFAELWRQDGLVVMSRGLGVRRLLAKFLLLHCMHGDAPCPPPALEKEVGRDGNRPRAKTRASTTGSGGVSRSKGEGSPVIPPPAVVRDGDNAAGRPESEQSSGDVADGGVRHSGNKNRRQPTKPVGRRMVGEKKREKTSGRSSSGKIGGAGKAQFEGVEEEEEEDEELSQERSGTEHSGERGTGPSGGGKSAISELEERERSGGKERSEEEREHSKERLPAELPGGAGRNTTRDAGGSFLEPGPAVATAGMGGTRSLVLCLNAKGEEDLLLDALMADGVPPNRLPEVVDAECTPGQRQLMYKAGGVFLVTSRVLIVDLLNKTVLPERISGMLVHKAHRVVETSSEAFILRIFREGNSEGFVKGFTDEPEALLAGFGKLEKILRNLGVAKVFLWPRFHSLVAERLEKNPPEVEELVQGLTGPTKEVQQAIVVLMDHTLRELRRTAPSLDKAELTVENCIFHSFDRSVKRQLEPEWHRVGYKTKQLLQDLKTLRSLLDYLFRYDAITFYQLLLGEKNKAAAVREPPLWIGTAAAERLFVTAKARIYKITQRAGRPGAAVSSSKGGASGGKSAGKRPVPTDEAPAGTDGNAASGKSAASHELTLMLEENAKWKLIGDVLNEIRDVHASRGRKKKGNEEEPAGGARVLVLVRDEHTCAQLRQHSALGGPLMMRRRFLEFVRDSEERTGRTAAAKGGRKGWKNSRYNRDSGGGGRGRGGRGGKSRGGGMQGVGIGASPAYPRGGGSARTGGGDGEGSGAAAAAKPSALVAERTLLKEVGEQLEVEMSISFGERLASSARNQGSRNDVEIALGADAARVLQSKGPGGRAGGAPKRQRGNNTSSSGGTRTPGDANRKPPASIGRGRRQGPGSRQGKGRARGAHEAREAPGALGAKASEEKMEYELEGGVIDSVDLTGDDNGDDDDDNSEYFAGIDKPDAPQAITGVEGPGSRGALREARQRGGEEAAAAAGTGDGRVPAGECRGMGRGWGGGRGGEGLLFEPLPALHVVMFSYAQAAESLNILQDLEPDFVVLYDPDSAFVRNLEAYQAERPRTRPPLTVYFMLYEQSVEEQRYLTSLDRETKAFKSLIEAKARMSVPVRTTSVVLPAGRPRGGTVTRLSVPAGGGSAGGGISSGQHVGVSRRGGGQHLAARGSSPLRVVVDLREFRSVLPNLLHQQGFELVPLVISIGDYVLTPEICVERKSLSDLFQSMSSGRLFNQVEAMLKHYKVPVLLIEFHPDKAFCLLGSGDLTSDIKLTSITSQLTLLTIHFPQLRVLWSKSEHATADMFKELMKNNSPVDVAKAQAAGGGGDDEGTGEEAAASAKELLMRLPGVNVHNYRNVLREVETIADLSELSEEELRPLLGAGNAAKLHKFFRQPAPL